MSRLSDRVRLAGNARIDEHGWQYRDGTLICPTGQIAPDGSVHTIIGCGAEIPDVRDDEGFADCPKCGIFWLPQLEQMT